MSRISGILTTGKMGGELRGKERESDDKDEQNGQLQQWDREPPFQDSHDKSSKIRATIVLFHVKLS